MLVLALVVINVDSDGARERTPAAEEAAEFSGHHCFGGASVYARWHCMFQHDHS